ncbi:LPS export ABC transporter permease LptG [Candidatus Pseudothioglobus sp. Uisw_086]|uniref:LPS export ABC transporter permease LptG n=1 Tax=Candidatus Pseudothioglobus sp. Uisw_086 TaxID=3230998 RepID=UPI003A882986
MNFFNTAILMKIRDRYIAKTLLSYTLTVLLVWLSIYSFFNFLTELNNNVGESEYSIIEAFKYILLQVPEVAYGQASPVILLGCILGMGHLATTNQLIILRASGVSIIKITWIVLKNALIFIIIMIVIGEFIAPILSKYAENSRLISLGQTSVSKTQKGFWIRDGSSYINVKNNIDGKLFSDITVIEVNESKKIEKVIHSKDGIFDGRLLDMSGSVIFSIDDDALFNKITLKDESSYITQVSFDEDLIKSLEKKPKELSTLTIIKQIEFLSNNKLSSGVFEVELYKRLVKPLTLVAMILLAMLFIFGSTRDVTLGRKIFFGVAIGLSFEMLSRIGGALSLSLDFSPLLSFFLPTFVVMILSITFLIQKSIN